MAYVALSRVRAMEDVQILDYDEHRITADPKVVQFYSALR